MAMDLSHFRAIGLPLVGCGRPGVAVALSGDGGAAKGAVAKEAGQQQAKKKKEVAPPKAKEVPKAAEAAAPAAVPAASGGDIQAKVTACGDALRVLKEKLKGEGMSGKKLNDHEEVKKLVAELQELKAQDAVAPAASAPAAAAPTAAPVAGVGDIAGKVTACGDALRVLKEKLKGEGLSGKKLNEHEEVKKLVAELQELKAQTAAAPAAPAPAAPAPAAPAPVAAAPAAAGGDIAAKVTACGDALRVLKEKLKGEGMSGKKLNDHEEVKKLVAELQELKAQAAVAPAASAPAAAAPAAAPASGGGDIAAKVTACGEALRALKEKLKGEGLSGKKLNDHEEVKKMVAELQELKKHAA